MRAMLLLALLSLPLASAGASETVNILPEPTEECSESYSSDYGGYTDDYGYYYTSYWWGYSSYQEGCEYTYDTANGNVTANGHEVLTFRHGQSDGWNYSYSSSYSDRYTYYWTNDSYSSWSSYSTEQSGASNGYYERETSATTELAGASLIEGCSQSEGSADSYESGSGTYWYEHGSYYSSGYEYQNSWWDNDQCATTASAESGVTDVSASKRDGCENAGSNTYYYQYSSSSHSGEWEDEGSYSSATQQCIDDAVVTAGEEQVTAGQHSDCEGYGWTEDEPWGNETNTTSTSYSTWDCERNTGVFGPTGLGVYMSEESYYAWSYNGEVQEEYSWTGRSLVVEQDYIGTQTIYIPLP